MLSPWKKTYDQPRQHIKKQRHYFAKKGPSTRSNGFSSSHVWMQELDHNESWALKNWCFWTVVWRKLLKVPWTAKRSNQWILKEISPEYSLEGLLLKLKFQSFGHLMWKTNSWKRPWCWERLKAGGKGDYRRWDGWMGLLTRWTWVWASSGSQAQEAWHAVIRGVAKSQIRLSDWNEPIKKQKHLFTDKSPYSKIYSFLSSHVQMWEMDHKEGWAPKNWCF